MEHAVNVACFTRSDRYPDLPLVPSPVPHLAKAISPEYAGFVLGVDAPDERIKADGERTKAAGFGSGLKGCDPGRFEFAERMS